MALGEREIAQLIAAAGYDNATPVAVGVSEGSATRLAAHARFGCDTVGYAGSLAKQVTGACVALLARDGTLDIEAPIASGLPELPPWAYTVRVRHLLHHTAGLPSTGTVWERMTAAGERDWTSDGAIAALATVPALDAVPGHAYAYSNAGYILLARIVERLSGDDLVTFARARLFEPLGMHSTRLWSGPDPAPPDSVHGPPSSPSPLSVGDGGLWTSVRDLLRWNDTLLDDTLGISSTLHTPGALDDGTPLEYAWGVRVTRVANDRVESHGGSWEGGAAKLVRLPDRGATFAAIALDGGSERMIELSVRLQDALLG